LLVTALYDTAAAGCMCGHHQAPPGGCERRRGCCGGGGGRRIEPTGVHGPKQLLEPFKDEAAILAADGHMQ
jgi:hypothetical protein